MPAVFPIDTSKPWTFNGVTYQYDASQGRWSVISTTASDIVSQSLSELENSINQTNITISQEIQNRTALIDAVDNRNESQDESLSELTGRIETIGANIVSLEFKGTYEYRLEHSEATCNAIYIACLADANNDPTAMTECSNQYDQCKLEIGDALPNGTFTSIGTATKNDIEEIVISNTTQDGTTFDWENLLETGDYLEIIEANEIDSVLYEVISDPILVGTEERIRVKKIRENGDGDVDFTSEEICEIRVLKQSLGLNLVEADIQEIQAQPKIVSSTTAPANPKEGDLWFNPSTIKFAFYTGGAWVNPDRS